MNVDTLQLKNFMSHSETSLHFPAAGVVVVTGGNGSGKSAMPEAVSWGVWGKTLRGTSPVPPGQTAEVRLATSAVQVKRSARKRTDLSWSVLDEAPVRYETMTKAQRAMENVVGTHDTWRRTHCFGSETSGFTAATDAERKRLLESLLGLDRYEVAYRACREDLKVVVKAVADLEHKIEVACTAIEGLEDRLADAQRSVGENLESTPPDLPDLKGLNAQLTMARARRRELEAEASRARAALTRAEMAATQARAQVTAIADDECPTCHQEIPESLREAVANAYSEAEATRKTEKATAMAVVDGVSDEIRSVADEMARLQREIGELAGRKSAAERERLALERSSRQIDTVTKQMEAQSADLISLSERCEVAEKDAAVLGVVAQVLGTKGYRAQMLDAALAGLEQAANAVLDHLTAGTLRVGLSSYTETKSGKVSDSIALTVTGAGGGQGYKAASAGERRRVDVAMVLALAQLSGADGTLWFDEVFDALDSEGVDRLAELLGSLAVDRVVVVITHSREFAKKVKAAQRWHVEDGHVST